MFSSFQLVQDKFTLIFLIIYLKFVINIIDISISFAIKFTTICNTSKYIFIIYLKFVINTTDISISFVIKFTLVVESYDFTFRFHVPILRTP